MVDKIIVGSLLDTSLYIQTAFSVPKVNIFIFELEKANVPKTTFV